MNKTAQNGLLNWCNPIYVCVFFIGGVGGSDTYGRMNLTSQMCEGLFKVEINIGCNPGVLRCF